VWGIANRIIVTRSINPGEGAAMDQLIHWSMNGVA